MKTQIGKYDRATHTIAVTFTSGAIVHKRRVNVVLNDAGQYDAAATADRVAEVANGVAHKIACGAIRADTPAE